MNIHLSNPDSIIGSPDGSMLYIVSLGGDDSTYVFDINTDGQLTNKRPFDLIVGDGSVDN